MLTKCLGHLNRLHSILWLFLCSHLIFLCSSWFLLFIVTLNNLGQNIPLLHSPVVHDYLTLDHHECLASARKTSSYHSCMLFLFPGVSAIRYVPFFKIWLKAARDDKCTLTSWWFFLTPDALISVATWSVSQDTSSLYINWHKHSLRLATF